MRKIACTALLLAFLAAAPALAAESTTARATLSACHTGAAPLDRYATFSGQMAIVSGATRMAMRFDLYQRLPGGDFQRVQAPGLGVWRSSLPGIQRFVLRKQVANLQAPASYRAVVRFHWLDAAGKVLQGASHRTRTCKQPDPRPDLEPGAVTAQPFGPGRARYTLVVHNAGHAETGSFDVAFSVGDAGQPDQSVETLLPGAQRTLTFVGPRCDARTLLHVTLDPALAVDESDETNNVQTVQCPL